MPQPDLQFASAFVRAHPEEAAQVLESAPPQSAAAFLAEMLPGQAAPVVARMGPVSAAGTLAALEPAFAARVLERVSPAVAAGIVRQLADPAPVLDELPDTLRATVSRLLVFPEGTAGAVADPSVLTVPSDIAVGDARRLLGRTPERAFLFTYVVDRGNRLVGVLDLRDLIAAQAGDKVADIMRPDTARLSARVDLRSVAVDPAWLSHEALPVVDETDTFLGVLHHRVLRQQARETVDPAGALSPIVGLAELYWTGFSRVLLGGSPGNAIPQEQRHAG
jgi:magnesium transporter